MKNDNHSNEARRSDRRIARLIAFGVVLFAALTNLRVFAGGVQWVLGLLSPIIVGTVIALVLNVPMHGFQTLFAKINRKGRLSEGLCDGISLLLAVICVPVILAVLMRFIVPQFISAMTNVINIVSSNRDNIAAYVARIGLDPSTVAAWLDEIIGWVNSNLGTIAGTAVNTIVSMVGSVMDVVIAIILAIYLLADKSALVRRCKRLVRAFLPENTSNYVFRCTGMFTSAFRIFLSMQCLEAVILGVMMLICMLIFRIPYAVTIACMTAVLALLPYIGAYLALAIGCVLVVTVSPMKALIFIIVFLVAQQVEGNLIYPRIVGKSVGLPAYITLAAVMIGGAIAGIAGMFFIIPVVSVIYTLLAEAVQKRIAEKDKAAEGVPCK